MSSLGQKSRIKKLSPLLINQLSAGEVVTRPASVVKELLENAIDAGATQITLNITQGGMGLIEIVDNGSGIHPDDMLMAVTRHATSKVADVEHLHGIYTLGFRGEALASIAAVSRLTLTSSHDDSGVGRCLTVAGQIDNPDITPVVCQRGTSVSVRDLYFNVPARRGSLKSIATEYAHIEAVVRHVALVYANIELNLYYEGKQRLSLPVVQQGHNSSAEIFADEMNAKSVAIFVPISVPISRLQQAITSPLPEIAHELSVDLTALSEEGACAWIQGYIWLAEDLYHTAGINDVKTEDKTVGKGAELPKLIYINARLVKDHAISQQIRQTLQSLNLTNRDMGYALFFTLPASWLNLNVHPSKQRINIHALANINAHLQHGLHQLLQPIVTAKAKHSQRLYNQGNQNNQRLPNQTLTESLQPIDKVDNNANEQVATFANVAQQHNSPKQAEAIDYISKINKTQSSEELEGKSAVNQVASPTVTYQLSGREQANITSKHLLIDPPYNKQLLCLTIWTENQSSKHQARQLAKSICQVLQVSAGFSGDSNNDSNNSINIIDIEQYYQVADSYRIRLYFMLEYQSSLVASLTDSIIELADRIASPWTVKYNRQTTEISLHFIKDNSSQFRQEGFSVIARADLEKVTNG